MRGTARPRPTAGHRDAGASTAGAAGRHRGDGGDDEVAPDELACGSAWTRRAGPVPGTGLVLRRRARWAPWPSVAVVRARDRDVGAAEHGV